ncbi:MAG: ABC transporter ATP-binding protein [Acidobacteria bacterium]|nr:ABC transporter ATP-binding protein [Acidobacteriota bacterium]
MERSSSKDSPFLVLDQVDKSFGELNVLSDIRLEVAEGEVLALLGPSGSGKTTALRLLGGFEQPDGGRILVQGQDVTPLPPSRRRFGMVFQHYALFPHMTVGENVAFGLETRGWERARIQDRVKEMLELVDLPGFELRRLDQTSGGQQQRVALARALAPEPSLLLLDEPLSNLDPSLRERTRSQLKEAIDRIGITTILVTHEQEEAFHLGNRVAVLHRGTLQQVGPPEELYERPVNRFVATFVGRASLLPGRLSDGEVRIRTGGREARWPGRLAAPAEPGAEVTVALRPESLRFTEAGTEGSLPGEVLERHYRGPLTYYRVRLEGKDPETDGRLEVEVLAAAGAAGIGDRLGVTVSPAGPAPRIFPLLREDGLS